MVPERLSYSKVQGSIRPIIAAIPTKSQPPQMALRVVPNRGNLRAKNRRQTKRPASPTRAPLQAKRNQVKKALATRLKHNSLISPFLWKGLLKSQSCGIPGTPALSSSSHPRFAPASCTVGMTVGETLCSDSCYSYRWNSIYKTANFSQPILD